MVQAFPLAHTSVVKVPELLELLSRSGIAVAPHVASALLTDLSSDVDAVLEVAGTLSPSQLSGHCALPDPLPLLPGLLSRVEATGAELDAVERAGLLAAAICVEDRTEVLLTQQRLSMGELIASRLGIHLLFVAGHFSFVDPRMRVWVHGSASLAERTSAHIDMQRAYTSMGEMDKATWHESLATLEGDNLLVPTLLELSRKENMAGNTVWAHAIAREASSHAVGAELFESQLCAGAAALNHGLVEEAAGWLGGAMSSPDVMVAARALPLFIHAESLLDGQAHTVVLARHGEAFLKRAKDLGAEGFATVARHVATAGGVAAGLCAARGMFEEASRLLGEAQRLVDVHQLDGLPLCAARHWCAIFGGPGAQPAFACRCRHCLEKVPDFSDARVVMDALGFGLDDDAHAGLRVLHQGTGAGRPVTGSGGGEVRRAASPLGLAYRAVAAALLQFWLGDVSRAAAELERAAVSVPVGLPFFGLGVVLARRLDVLTTAEVGALAQAMEASCPVANAAFIRTGDLVDRTLAAYLAGRVEEASTLGRLAAERALLGAASPLHVPGFDEMAPRGSATADAGFSRQNGGADAGPRMPSGHRRASSARMALCSTDNARFAKDYEYAAKVSVTLLSHYERARTEFVLGQACLKHGTAAVAREHLVLAGNLFREVGAMAWLRCVENTLGSMQEPERHVAVRVPEPGNPLVGRGDGPLQRCRQVWGGQLTERELEVAMLVVDGAPNRQVAAQLHVSVRTVEVHLCHVFTKLNVRSRVELSVLAHRMGNEWLAADT